MTASTTIGILSALLVGIASIYASVTGAPGWLAGNETEFFLKASGLLALVVFAERMWRSGGSA